MRDFTSLEYIWSFPNEVRKCSRLEWENVDKSLSSKLVSKSKCMANSLWLCLKFICGCVRYHLWGDSEILQPSNYHLSLTFHPVTLRKFLLEQWLE